MEKQVLKEPNSVQMIDARAAKLSDYCYPVTKGSNWTAVVGYLRDRATISQQIGAPEPITSEHFAIDTIIDEIAPFDIES